MTAVEMTGAQILMKILKEEGVDTLFGYPGGAVIDIYDELGRTDIRHILVRHEQAAVHAADGYARASGKVGACLVTSGPGATNTVTGIASAYADSIPIVIITGQVPTHLIGNDAFQEVDIVGITRPCTKHNYLVKSLAELAPTLKEAFYLARSGPARAGARRYPQEYRQRTHAVSGAGGPARPALLGHPPAACQTTAERVQAYPGSPAAPDLRRRRRHSFRRIARADATGAALPNPGHHLADGAGCFSGR